MVMAVLQHMLDADVVIEPYTGQTRSGATYGAKQTYRAKVERGAEFTDPQATGQAVFGRFKVLLGTAVLVDVRDRLTLPAEFGARDTSGDFQEAQPPILEARPVFYMGRHDHTVLICG